MDGVEKTIAEKTAAWEAAREDRIVKFTQATASRAVHDGDHAAAIEAMQLELKLSGELVQLATALPTAGEQPD
jgi:hypothetical protein